MPEDGTIDGRRRVQRHILKTVELVSFQESERGVMHAREIVRTNPAAIKTKCNFEGFEPSESFKDPKTFRLDESILPNLDTTGGLVSKN